jgi:hypothetical protein
VTGKILDAKDDAPLPGVTISTGGQNIGATKIDGSFSVTVPVGAKNLTFSYVGYNDIEVAITDGPISTKMVRGENRNLSEVVVTGYSSIQRKKFSGSSVAVNIEDVRTQTFGSSIRLYRAMLREFRLYPTQASPVEQLRYASEVMALSMVVMIHCM